MNTITTKVPHNLETAERFAINSHETIPVSTYIETTLNPARQALTNTVNRAIAEGSPVYTEIPVKPIKTINAFDFAAGGKGFEEIGYGTSPRKQVIRSIETGAIFFGDVVRYPDGSTGIEWADTCPYPCVSQLNVDSEF